LQYPFLPNADRVGERRFLHHLHRGATYMAVGTVKWFNSQKGFGFIQPEDGSKDAFVHISAVERAGLAHLSEGQRVQYDLTPGKNGKSSAENLKVVG
jgi:cold shock protein